MTGPPSPARTNPEAKLTGLSKEGGPASRPAPTVSVLAEPAAQVAPGRPERQDRRPGQEVIERLLLDRVHAEAAGAPVGGQDDRVTLPHPHEAEPPLPLLQTAGPRAHVALGPPVAGAVPVLRRHRGTVHRLPSPTLPPG